VVPLFIWDPDAEAPWQPGAAHRWWLHRSLGSLASDLDEAGSRLVIRAGSSEKSLQSLIEETGASRVYWNERYEPAVRRRDAGIAQHLSAAGIDVVRYQSCILHDPDSVRTGSDGPYRVFSPFWKKFLKTVEVPDPLPAPDLQQNAPDEWPEGLSVDDLGLLPDIDWAAGLREAWNPGEAGAYDALTAFIDESVKSYDLNRDYPARDGTSRLSPHLRFGEISPRRVWNEICSRAGDGDGPESFLREIGWREFSYHLLYHFPQTTTAPLDSRYAAFPWKDDEELLRTWQKGRTGYPIVDAGMRPLWHIGWMHNRVRMIAASFLTKDLLIHWLKGARWFWDTLIDGDLANNTQGWQWAAGSGADAQPFFRIFNPVSQGQRFDPDGDYVRRWVPEISKLPDRYLHCPWEAPPDVLYSAGVKLGSDYPGPVVDHAAARKKALAAFENLS
jgi:deoxyribodipyrimidine photo-lyase